MTNPFNILGVRDTDTLEALSQDPQIRRVKADYTHRVHSIGDIPVAFVDALNGRAGINSVLPASATVGEHLVAAQWKIDQFTHGKDVPELLEKGLYVGACVVGVTVSGPDSNPVLIDSVRLAIFEPTSTRIL